MTQPNERLSELFNRRPDLSAVEWSELYGLIKQILNAYKGWHFDNPEDKEDRIHDFFLNKILAPTSKDHSHYDCRPALIITMFKNFESDYGKKPSQKLNTVSLDIEENDDTSNPQDKCLEDGHRFDFSPDQLEETLCQYGLTRDQITRSASDFFKGLEAYAQYSLSHHLCADADRAVPITTIQQRYPQSATYYKINKLGILHKRNPMPADYDRTAIGQWLKNTLNSEIDSAHISIISIALQILCVVALEALDV